MMVSGYRILIALVLICHSLAFKRVSRQSAGKMMRSGSHFSQKLSMVLPVDDIVTHSHIISESINHAISSSSHLFDLHQQSHSMMLSDEGVAQGMAASDVSAYSKVDKTGFIGFLADNVEKVIDFSRGIFKSMGVENSYGYAIILFTLFVKAATYPLASTQIQSTAKMQKLTPLQQKIQAKYANDEQMKNQLIAQLYQVSQANPLAGCFPALVQIPIFISLYRALQNLVAENKLDEPFLWIPNLEGPSFRNPPSIAMDWIKTAVTGNPSYGWHDTLAYLTIPLILFISQSISMKILQPQKDKSQMTEQELFSQSLLNSLPLVVASFSLNVPAGLGVYWVVNNVLTTLITLFIKNNIKDEPLPAEVDQLMAMVDSPLSASKLNAMSSSFQEFRGQSNDQKKKDTSGFGAKTVETEIIPETKSTDMVTNVSMESNPASVPAASNIDDDSSEVTSDESGGKKKRLSKKEKKRRA